MQHLPGHFPGTSSPPRVLPGERWLQQAFWEGMGIDRRTSLTGDPPHPSIDPWRESRATCFTSSLNLRECARPCPLRGGPSNSEAQGKEVYPVHLLMGTHSPRERGLCHCDHIFLENSHSSVLSLGLHQVIISLLSLLGSISGLERLDVAECAGVPF